MLGGVLGAVVVRQVAGRGPPVWVLFVAGALLTVVSGTLSVSGAEASVAAAAPVLVFLFSLFLFAAALEQAGALDHLARWLVGRARRPSELPAVVFVGFGLCSAFLVNDALVVIGAPVLIGLARRTGLAPRPLLLVLAYSVTVGSVFTPFGNPQNLLVSLDSGVAAPTATFLRYLLVPTLVSLGLGAWLLRRMFARDLVDTDGRYRAARTTIPRLFPTGGWADRLRRSPVLWVFPGTLLVLFTFDLAAAVTGGPNLPSWEVAAAGAVVLLLASPVRTAVVRRVNWEILLLFAGLFVVVGGAVAGGVVGQIDRLAPVPGPASGITGVLAIGTGALVGSQLVSNVPWVALQIPLLRAAGYGAGSPLAWMSLAGAATLAGNVTLLGAASNLIVADLAEKEGIPFRLGTFVRYGLPLSAISVGVLFVALWAGV